MAMLNKRTRREDQIFVEGNIPMEYLYTVGPTLEPFFKKLKDKGIIDYIVGVNLQKVGIYVAMVMLRTTNTIHHNIQIIPKAVGISSITADVIITLSISMGSITSKKHIALFDNNHISFFIIIS